MPIPILGIVLRIDSRHSFKFELLVEAIAKSGDLASTKDSDPFKEKIRNGSEPDRHEGC